MVDTATLKQELQKDGTVAVLVEKRTGIGQVETDSIKYLKDRGFPVSHLKTGKKLLGLRLPKNVSDQDAQLLRRLAQDLPGMVVVPPEEKKGKDKAKTATPKVNVPKASAPKATTDASTGTGAYKPGDQVVIGGPQNSEYYGKRGTVKAIHPTHDDWVIVTIGDKVMVFRAVRLSPAK